MRLAALSAEDFRNLQGEIWFPQPLTLLAGENNSGKSNVIDALRLLVPPRAGMRFSSWITSEDFRHDAQGIREVDTFELTALSVDLSEQERGRMLTCLAPSVDARAAKLRMVAQLRPTGRAAVTWYGGAQRLEPVPVEVVDHPAHMRLVCQQHARDLGRAHQRVGSQPGPWST